MGGKGKQISIITFMGPSSKDIFKIYRDRAGEMERLQLKAKGILKLKKKMLWKLFNAVSIKSMFVPLSPIIHVILLRLLKILSSA